MWRDILKRKPQMLKPKQMTMFKPRKPEMLKPKPKSVPVRLNQAGLKRADDPNLPPAPNLPPTEEMKRKEEVENLLEEQR